MIKGNLIFTILLLVMYSASAQKQNFTIDFIGYDGQSPIFASYEVIDGIYLGHEGIYKYTDGCLTKMDMPIQKGTLCFTVKNGVYVFGYGDSLYHPTKLQFKRNGRELFFEQAVAWPAYLDCGRVTMNDEELFTIADGANDGDIVTIIFRIKYRNQAPIDTIKIKGHCVYLLDATKDYLYYVIEYPNDPNDDYYGPERGSIYRMSLRDGSVDVVETKMFTVSANFIGIVPHLNLVYVHGAIVDYSKNIRIQSQKFNPSATVFFSYEHNAFIDYKTFSDIHKWDCYHLAPGGKLPTALRSVPCFKGVNGTK
jgi:hypothetical protein